MYNKLKANYEKGGLDTVVQHGDGDFIIFSSTVSNGGIRGSEWEGTIEKCKDSLGSMFYSERDIEEGKEYNWKIIKTIARESHYKVGDKVKVINYGLRTITEVLNSGDYRLKDLGYNYNLTQLEPYFEEEPEKMITLSNGKKVSESTIIEALKGLVK